MSEESFIAEIQQEPLEPALRLVYADWLEERGDIRAEYLRQELELYKLPPPEQCLSESELTAADNEYHRQYVSLLDLSEQIEEDWTQRVGLPFDLVIFSWGNKKLHAVKIVKTLTNVGLLDAKNLTESAPAVIGPRLSFPAAASLASKYSSLVSNPSLLRSDPATTKAVDPFFGIQPVGILKYRPEILEMIERNAIRKHYEENVDLSRGLTPMDDIVDLFFVSSGGSQVDRFARLVAKLTEMNKSKAFKLLYQLPARILSGLNLSDQESVSSQLQSQSQFLDPSAIWVFVPSLSGPIKR